MINFNKFHALNWEFKFSPRDITSSANWFNFKSPRMREARHYNTIIQANTDEDLIKYECECYLNQLMFNINKQLGAVEMDIKRQLKIHVDRNLPIPPELGIDIKLKIV